MAADTPSRPRVSVVIPFFGAREDAAEALRSAARIELREGDEVVLADNTPDGVAAGLATAPRQRVVPAPAQQSSYHARNVGAEAAEGDWLLFVDSDCRPAPDVLSAFFAEAPGVGVGAVAGAVRGAPGQQGLVPSYSRSRGILDQTGHAAHEYLPFANTSNLLVRREAWASVGGFQEGIRSGGDADFCWRVQLAGWELGFEPSAVVEHEHRESVRRLARQMARYGAGHSWLDRRHPGRFPRHRWVRHVSRALVGAAGLAVLGRRERATFRALDAVHFGALGLGWYLGNGARAAPRPTPPGALSVGLLTDSFPEVSQTFVSEEARALVASGHTVAIEARIRPARPNTPALRGLTVGWQEDDGVAERLRDALWLAARAPREVGRDLRERRVWVAGEGGWVPPLRQLAPQARRLHRAGVRHLHVHFAAGAALDTMRMARLLGLPWSLTAHAYDIYLQPRNLELKLAAADFVTSGCDYTVEDLRRLAPPGRRDRVHKVVMGIDPERFRRSGPLPGGRTVAAVGRLVEKKGFAHLIDALALLEQSDPVERLVVVGTGPLEEELRERADRAGLGQRVEWAGARTASEVREVLERSDLLAMPCVVARDGDRDSMPVVVKEALAMELPVVCTDEVGLPELVSEEWGRLVPPGDPASLAEAIGELLSLPLERRAEMGRAGREFVSSFADLHAETARLARLIARARPASG